MSFLHPEEQRVCKKCGQTWFAERWTKMDTAQPVIGAGFTKRSQDLNRQTVQEKRIRLHELWAKCPSCGSSKVKTSKKSRQPGSQASANANASELSAPQGPTEPAVAVQPGWYDDPLGIAGQVRWWDGASWTNTTASR